MSKGLTLGVIMLAAAAVTSAVTMALMMNTALVKQAFATGGQCSTCALSFTPKSLSSGLSGSGENGAEKVFAPGQEAQATGGSASDFSPGHEKP
jgi:hypothetical protein